MLPNDRSSYQQYTCENGELKLPAGTYELRNIEFKSGVSIDYKIKMIEMIPDKATLITFKLPDKSNLEVHRQGVYVVAEYTPKGYYDEEFYSNRKSPPVFELYHNRRLVYTAVSDYG